VYKVNKVHSGAVGKRERRVDKRLLFPLSAVAVHASLVVAGEWNNEASALPLTRSSSLPSAKAEKHGKMRAQEDETQILKLLAIDPHMAPFHILDKLEGLAMEMPN
jgi:hypothetical protein